MRPGASTVKTLYGIKWPLSKAFKTLNLKAYTISIAELRRSVEAPDEVVRVIPLLEREERTDAQKLRLSGVDLEAFIE